MAELTQQVVVWANDCPAILASYAGFKINFVDCLISHVVRRGAPYA